MTKPLPTLKLVKDSKIFIVGVECQGSTFSFNSNFETTFIDAHNADIQLSQLSTISDVNNKPLGLVSSYDLLSENDFETVKKLRANPVLKHMPIVAIAEMSSEVHAEEIFKNGLDDCYVQPVGYEDIFERIMFLNKYKSKLESIDNTKEDVLKIKIPIFKRLLDVFIALAVLMCFSPLFLIIGLLIRLESRGPVIYRQKRSGTGYNVFDFLKFRSMYADADQRLAEMKHLNQYADQNSAFVKFNNDPRITKVGKFIRKTSIDEIPQLINVLKGDMSIVGNRPLPLYEAEQLTIEDASYRFLAPAGLTGLWQVSKRGSADMSAEERINLDVTYAKKFSFWYDIKIMLKTPFAIIQKENV
jgi:lipopolysaccharide/colanic/teichoic acid biosynthesis glycosyltransferase